LTCKNRIPYNLYCVGWDVKHCALTHPSTSLITLCCSDVENPDTLSNYWQPDIWVYC